MRSTGPISETTKANALRSCSVNTCPSISARSTRSVPIRRRCSLSSARQPPIDDEPGPCPRADLSGDQEAPDGSSVAGRLSARYGATRRRARRQHERSEEHTSELQSLMRISYAGFCFQTNKSRNQQQSSSEKKKIY